MIAFNMTVPMVVWMQFRGMDWRPIWEMSCAMVMVVEAIVLIGVAWLGVIPNFIWQHALMAPAMAVPVPFRLDHYTKGMRLGRSRHVGHVAHVA